MAPETRPNCLGTTSEGKRCPWKASAPKNNGDKRIMNRCKKHVNQWYDHGVPAIPSTTGASSKDIPVCGKGKETAKTRSAAPSATKAKKSVVDIKYTTGKDDEEDLESDAALLLVGLDRLSIHQSLHTVQRRLDAFEANANQRMDKADEDIKETRRETGNAVRALDKRVTKAEGGRKVGGEGGKNGKNGWLWG